MIILKKSILKSLLLLVAFSTYLASCGQPRVESQPVGISPGLKQADSIQEAVADFSEGCFWHSEIVFQSLVGVRDAVSGYAGGTDPNPTYEKVCSGATGHAETVEVHYDPSKISFKTLVEAFFASQDPTTVNRQGNDEGTEYRSIAFYRTPEEKVIIENEIKKLTNEKKFTSEIVTEVKPFTNFYPAEAYHQEYIMNNPWDGYVKNVSIPDFEEFKKNFNANYKR